MKSEKELREFYNKKSTIDEIRKIVNKEKNKCMVCRDKNSEFVLAIEDFDNNKNIKFVLFCSNDCKEIYFDKDYCSQLYKRNESIICVKREECKYCGTQNLKKIFKKCGKCKKVYYCNRECQLNDWKEHKIICSK